MKKRWFGILGLLVATAAYAGVIVHGQLIDASAENLGSDPTAHLGRFYYNTGTNLLKYYDGAWQTVVTTATSLSNPMTTLGDIIVENSTPAAGRLAGNTTSTKKFLTQTGNGSISALPGWNTIVTGDLPVATASANGATTSYVPAVQSEVKSVSSAGYTVLDADGYGDVLVSTGASDRTITLPVVANNTGRRLSIKKTDSGSGTVIIAVNTGLIDGASSNTLHQQYSFETLVCDGSNWSVLQVSDYMDLTFNGQGLSSTGAYNGLGNTTLSPGFWIWDGTAELVTGTPQTVSEVQFGVSTSASSFDTSNAATGGYYQSLVTPTTSAGNFYPIGPRKFALTSAQAIYFGEAITYSSCTSCSINGSARIKRVL